MADKGDIGIYAPRRAVILSYGAYQARTGGATASITGATANAALRLFHSRGALYDSIYADSSGAASFTNMLDGSYYVHQLDNTRTWLIVVASGVATVTRVSPGTVGYAG